MLPLGGLFLGTELIPLFPNLRAGMEKKGGGSVVYFRLSGFWYQTLTLWGSQESPGLEIIISPDESRGYIGFRSVAPPPP